MKPDEPLYPGMVVWNDNGAPVRIVSIIVAVGEVQPDGTMSWESTTRVKVAPENVPDGTYIVWDIPLDTFMTTHYRRTTGWERLDHDRFEPWAYEGPLEGYHCLKVGDRDPVRIADRTRKTREILQSERDAVFAGRLRSNVAYREWYEKFEATGWKLVLEPAL